MNYSVNSAITKYEELASDEEKAVFIAAIKFLEIIEGQAAGIALDTIAYNDATKEMNLNYYKQFEISLKTGDPVHIDDYLSSSMGTAYNASGVLKSLCEDLPEIIKNCSDLNNLSAQDKADTISKIFGILDNVSGVMNESLVSTYISVLFGMGSLALKYGAMFIEEHNKKLEEVINACMAVIPKNKNDDRSSFCNSISNISHYLISYNSDIEYIQRYYDSISSYIDVADIGQKIKNEMSSITDNISELIKQLNSSLEGITLTKEEQDKIDGLYYTIKEAENYSAKMGLDSIPIGSISFGGVKKSANEADKSITTAENIVYDPLVIDLGKSGFELTGIEDGVHFDMDLNGFAEKTGWITGDDAFLALDLNGDGKINNSRELFGDRTLLSDGTYAKSGFEALAQYDYNLDGLIDAHDEIYNRLLIWQDKNKDGISTSDELMTLKEAGITSINLNYTEKILIMKLMIRFLQIFRVLLLKMELKQLWGNLNFLQTVLILRITLNLR